MLNVKSSILNSMHAPSVMTGVTWSDLLIPETKHAAQFLTHCTLSISRLGTPQYKLLQ